MKKNYFDKNETLVAVSNDESALKFASSELKADRDVVLAAVETEISKQLSKIVQRVLLAKN